MMKDIRCKVPFPYGEALCIPLKEVSEYHQTSGTTGQPVYQADSWQDFEWRSECWAYILWTQGYRPHDRIFFPFGYNVFVAFRATHYSAEKIGAEIVPGGVLDTKARILKIQEIDIGEYIDEPGKIDKMIITAFGRYAQPCIRFDSKDLIMWSSDPCSCGRSFGMIKGGVYGRSDAITKEKSCSPRSLRH